MPIDKDQHEAFAEFFATPSRATFKGLIQRQIGETDYLDFKEDWPDPAALAKHALALANSGGGALVVGVHESPLGAFMAVGLPTLKSKTDIALQLQRLIPKTLRYTVLDFSYASGDHGPLTGKSFQTFLVEDEPQGLPYLATADGPGLRRNALYVRSGTSTRDADHDDFQRIINRRVATGHSSQPSIDVDRNFAQLRTLDELRDENDSWISRISREVDGGMDDRESSNFKEFVEAAYHHKKVQIWAQLGLGELPSYLYPDERP